MDLTCDDCGGPCKCGKLLRDAKRLSARLQAGGVLKMPARPAGRPNEEIIAPPSTGLGEGTKH